MKINFIVNEEDQNSTLDANILSFLFKKIKDNTEIKMVNVNNFKCDNASINFFLGTMNNLLLTHAKFNILIPNNHTFKRSDVVHLSIFDYVLCKSKYIQSMFEPHVSTEKLKFISWRSTDLNNNRCDKDFNSFLLYCYDKQYTQYNTIIENWKDTYPTLHVINYKEIKKADNIDYHSTTNTKDFDKLFNICGFHICLNEIDSFSHNINQCALSKSIPIIINGSPMNELINSDHIYSIQGRKKKLTQYIGNKSTLSISGFHGAIESILKIKDHTLFENMGGNCKNDALKNHSMNDSLFKDTIKEIFNNLRSTPKNTPEKIEEYPKVSIVTLVHNRYKFFNLSIYNFNNATYERNKIEWIVYDTSTEDERVEKLLPPKKDCIEQNIRYIYDSNKMSIGETRNRAISECSNEIILFQDDDDFYYPNHIKTRVEGLLLSKKNIVGCPIIACFNINKCISFIESHPITNNLEDKISVATLGFYKSVWENNKFSDDSINEAYDFLKNNLTELHEISWEDIIVSLVHKYNTTNRVTPNSQPNGNHYGFSKGLFKYLIELQN